jgi:broad specificity phosphatase PhoE
MIKNNQFYILRHGKTKYQKFLSHRIYPLKGSLKSIGLIKEGRKKVKESALEIKKKKIDLIYSSDFLRTKQTSLIVARFINLPKENIIFSEKLRDSNLGIYHGQLKKKWEKDTDNRRKYYNKPYMKPLQGENVKQVLKRMVDFIEKIDRKHKNKKILIVSHGDPLWLLEKKIKGKNMNDLLTKKNTGKNYIQTGEWRKLN